MTTTGDYHQVEEQWQVECTEHQIAFMCCTPDCKCHDPVDTSGKDDDPNDISDRSPASGTTTSSSIAITVGVVGSSMAVLGALGLAAYGRRRTVNEEEQQLGELLTEDSINSL